LSEEDLDFLALIGSTEETSFNELCSALGDDCPHEKSEWRDLFMKIERMERDGYIEVSRLNGRLEGLMLSESGASLIRERLDAKRGLLSIL